MRLRHLTHSYVREAYNTETLWAQCDRGKFTKQLLRAVSLSAQVSVGGEGGGRVVYNNYPPMKVRVWER